MVPVKVLEVYDLSGYFDGIQGTPTYTWMANLELPWVVFGTCAHVHIFHMHSPLPRKCLCCHFLYISLRSTPRKSSARLCLLPSKSVSLLSVLWRLECSVETIFCYFCVIGLAPRNSTHQTVYANLHRASHNPSPHCNTATKAKKFVLY